MALLDRLRRRPRWEDPDPKVRAEGVREIPAEEQDQLAQIATGDADPLVRRAAGRRLRGAGLLPPVAPRAGDARGRGKAGGAPVPPGPAAHAAPAGPPPA